jgi:hypothetical protein
MLSVEANVRDSCESLAPEVDQERRNRADMDVLFFPVATVVIWRSNSSMWSSELPSMPSLNGYGMRREAGPQPLAETEENVQPGVPMQDTQTLNWTAGQSLDPCLASAHNGKRFVFCKTTCHPTGVSSEKRNEFSGVVTNTPGGSGSDGLRTSTPPPSATPPSLQVTCCSTELLGPTVVGVKWFNAGATDHVNSRRRCLRDRSRHYRPHTDRENDDHPTNVLHNSSLFIPLN